MAERQTLGVPNLRTPVVQDAEVSRAFQDFNREVTFWLQKVVEAIDTQAGLRGTPTFHRDIDVRGNRLTQLAPPQADADAVRADLALRRTSKQASFNAEGMNIDNLSPADQPQRAVNLSQLREAKDELQRVIDTTVVTLTGNQTITGLKTFDRDPGAPFAVTASSALVANLDSQLWNGQSYESDTFTVSASGFTAAVTGTARFQRAGNIVLLFLPTLTGTSNATTFTLSGFPVAIQSTQDGVQLNHVTVEDNGTTQPTPGQVQIRSGATDWDVFLDAAQTAFTGAGTKTLFATFVAYHRS